VGGRYWKAEFIAGDGVDFLVDWRSLWKVFVIESISSAIFKLGVESITHLFASKPESINRTPPNENEPKCHIHRIPLTNKLISPGLP
jgi:hypothetical protein